MIKLRNKIPEEDKDLFNFKVKWKYLIEREIILKKVRRFLERKSVELFQIEEENFINMTMKLIEK